MDRAQLQTLLGKLDTEAEYALRMWDHAWNGGWEGAARGSDEEREYLRLAIHALGALGNIRHRPGRSHPAARFQRLTASPGT